MPAPVASDDKRKSLVSVTRMRGMLLPVPSPSLGLNPAFRSKTRAPLTPPAGDRLHLVLERIIRPALIRNPFVIS
jgi:hypothetical protein